MAQGLFCTLLIGTILKTIGTEAGVDFFDERRLLGSIYGRTGNGCCNRICPAVAPNGSLYACAGWVLY